MSAPVRHAVTPEQYLAAERQATERHEYVNGSVFAMVGASRAHNLITANLIRELTTQLRGRPCETYGSDMRVKVVRTGLYTYPDVVVVCGEPEFEDGQLDTLLNPTLLVEVLSPSTERYDRGDKFAHYRQLPSLAEYVLVAQHRPALERFVRQGRAWLLDAVAGLDATATLEAVGCTLPLRAVYERVTFTDEESRGPTAE
jgi:Uma2 family endonuclease